MSNTNDSTNSSSMMSTDPQNNDKKADKKTEPQNHSETGENTSENTSLTPSKAKRWSFIQNDLEKALDTWQELEKTQAKLSPEEEQFEKIKTIIGQLKSKIEQF